MTSSAQALTTLDVTRIRADFPILSRATHAQPNRYPAPANSPPKPAPIIHAIATSYPHPYRHRHRASSPPSRLRPFS